VVAEEIAVQRPAAAVLADIDVHHGAREQSVAMQFSLGSHVQTVRIEAMLQRGSQRGTRGMIRSEGGSRRRVGVRVVCGVLRLVRVAGLEERIVYILSIGRSRHMADVAGRHSQPARVVGKITIVDEAVVPSHAAGKGARQALGRGSERNREREREVEA
jgi:hypothetical protein